jgi:uncharacterized protein (DUF1778 family)
MAHAALGVRGGGSGTHDVMRVRLPVEAKAIRSRAAASRSQTPSEVVRGCALRQAMETILDQRTFFLDRQTQRTCLAMVDWPAKPSAELREWLKRRLAWGR